MEQLLSQIRKEMEIQGFCQEWVESLPILAKDLEAYRVQNITAWLREIKSRLSDKEQYLDVWTQGWFASVLAHNGFTVTMNASGGIGPDLLAQAQGQDMYVEVRRFVADNEERRRLKEAGQQGLLVQYGDFTKDTRRIPVAMQSKSRQGQGIPAGASYIVVIRSDKESIEEIEFQSAVKDLEREASEGGGQYAAVGAVLFYHGYVNMATGKRWYLWRNPNAAPGRCPPSSIAERLQTLVLPPPHPRPPHLKSKEPHE